MTSARDLVAEVVSFEVRLTPAGETVWIEPTGELDLATAPQLRRHVDELLVVGFTALLVDLRGLSFIDLAGLGLIVELAAEARADGWTLALIQGRSSVRRLFTLAGVAERLPFRSAGALSAEFPKPSPSEDQPAA